MFRIRLKLPQGVTMFVGEKELFLLGEMIIPQAKKRLKLLPWQFKFLPRDMIVPCEKNV
jgi:hypothetical protein